MTKDNIELSGEYILVTEDADGNVTKYGNWRSVTDEELSLEYTPPVQVWFKRLSDAAMFPTRAHATDSGYDLYALEDTVIEPGETKVIPTGIAIVLPEGYEAQVRPRSGVTAKTKLRVQLGTIDNGYVGDIGVIVDNIAPDYCPVHPHLHDGVVTIDNYIYDEEGNDNSYIIRAGDRIAQLVVQALPKVEAYEVEGELGETERGSNGYGSTGVKGGRFNDE